MDFGIDGSSDDSQGFGDSADATFTETACLFDLGRRFRRMRSVLILRRFGLRRSNSSSESNDHQDEQWSLLPSMAGLKSGAQILGQCKKSSPGGLGAGTGLRPPGKIHYV